MGIYGHWNFVTALDISVQIGGIEYWVKEWMRLSPAHRYLELSNVHAATSMCKGGALAGKVLERPAMWNCIGEAWNAALSIVGRGIFTARRNSCFKWTVMATISVNSYKTVLPCQYHFWSFKRWKGHLILDCWTYHQLLQDLVAISLSHKTALRPCQYHF